MLEYAHMPSMSSISVSVSDADLEPGQKMQLVVSISPPRGWRLVSQNGQELVYERSGPGGSGSTNFEIRAFTTVKSC
jgi:hypothetical protein